MDRLDVGDVIEDRYRVDHPIARGGMATVYRCVDLRLGRAVAAKVMHDDLLDDPVFVQRFRREARAMAQLQHPNLLAVHDFSADGDPVFLIMELITGGTLRELLAERGPMPPYAAASVLREVLTGLREVHRHGMVHRDIKPDNILINGDNGIKVGDFGLVRSTTARTVNADQIVGTVSYLSPEQVTGDKITPASDVYSAGIVLFELLTGTVPFAGETPLAHATARLSADVPAPSDLIAGVPPLVDALVASATTRDVEGRFTDAGEFLDALDDVARALELPTFTVPVPQHSAAARTAAQPADMSGVGATDIFAPTGLIETAMDSGETEKLDERPQLSFTRRLDAETAADLDPQQSKPEPRPESEPGPCQISDLDPSSGPGLGPSASAASPTASPWGAVPASATRYDPFRDASVPHTAVEQAQQRGTVSGGASPSTASRKPAETSPADANPPVAGTAETEPPEKVLTNRGIGKLLAWLVFSALVTIAVAVGGWWFGSGAYEQLPVLFR